MLDTDIIPNAYQQGIFACPFAKKDPIIHEHCHNYELREIKHVRQHLKRCHLIVVCPRCRECFNAQDLLGKHLARGCEVRDLQDPEGMSPRQHELLKAKTSHEMPLEDQWYYIWDVLFPALPRPATPYKDEFRSLSEFRTLLRNFRDQQIPSLADRVMHEMEGTAVMSPYDQAVFIANRTLSDLIDTLQKSGFSQSGHASDVPPGSATVSAVSKDSTHNSTEVSHDSGYYSTSSTQNLFTPSSALDPHRAKPAREPLWCCDNAH